MSSKGFFDIFDISMIGDVVVENGEDDQHQRTFQAVYNISSEVETTVRIFEEDCKTPAELILPMNYSVVGDEVTVEVGFNFMTVESLSIWNTIYNVAGQSTGGFFQFCLRLGVIHIPTGYEMNFLENVFNVGLSYRLPTNEDPDDPDGPDDPDDPDGGFLGGIFDGLNLTIVRQRAQIVDDENVYIDFSASIEAFQCNTSTFTNATIPISQGSQLGICVRSLTSGIELVSWNSLTLSRNGFEFIAVKSGIAIDSLVEATCDPVTSHCTADVQTLSFFFQDDGELTVTGFLTLQVVTNSTSRQLDVTTDIGFSRKLDEDIPAGGQFEVPVVTLLGPSGTRSRTTSVATSLNSPYISALSLVLITIMQLY